jgi:hypothetical protein
MEVTLVLSDHVCVPSSSLLSQQRHFRPQGFCYSNNTLAYGFFCGVEGEELDGWTFGMDEYRSLKCDKGYVEWFRDNKQKIEDGIGFKGGVLGLRT